MASIYRCAGCDVDLNLNTAHRYPPGTHFDAGDKDTISFFTVDYSKFQFTNERTIRPFFETVDYWGIERTRIKMKCTSCGHLVGYIYQDGLPIIDGIPIYNERRTFIPRYRLKIKALNFAC